MLRQRLVVLKLYTTLSYDEYKEMYFPLLSSSLCFKFINRGELYNPYVNILTDKTQFIHSPC